MTTPPPRPARRAVAGAHRAAVAARPRTAPRRGMCEATAAHHMHVHVMCVRWMHCGMHCAAALWGALYVECTSPLARPETTRATEACSSSNSRVDWVYISGYTTRTLHYYSTTTTTAAACSGTGHAPAHGSATPGSSHSSGRPGNRSSLRQTTLRL